ncbi:hypothetical protein HPB50_018808 [Hyalomma asiaticum]|uniref:Uncharacterized protein n=1 Tax=Hyalomma asiaticum TaxID=266040 RepID=A0ACB7TMM0_HYAAI|nr:hypothetical protein HPB50_018808 [Hyalomma asiaticum]
MDDAAVAAVRSCAEVATDDDSDGEDDVDMNLIFRAERQNLIFLCKDTEYLTKVKVYCAKNSLSEKSL